MDITVAVELVRQIAQYQGKKKEITEAEKLAALSVIFNKEQFKPKEEPIPIEYQFLDTEDYSYISERRETLLAFVKAKRDQIPTLNILRESIKEYLEFVFIDQIIDEKNQRAYRILLNSEKISSLELLALDAYRFILEMELIKRKERRASDALSNQTPLKVAKDRKGKNIGAKYYALYHLILIEIGKAKPFERDYNDNLSKQTIVDYAEEAYPFWKNGNGFYHEFQKLQGKSKTDIARNFGIGYKDKIISISNNDSKVISLLRNYPN
jgi:hypothetical protein